MVRPRSRPGCGEQIVELYALWGQAALSRIDENEPETFLVDCVLPTVAFGMLQVEIFRNTLSQLWHVRRSHLWMHWATCPGSSVGGGCVGSGRIRLRFEK